MGAAGAPARPDVRSQDVLSLAASVTAALTAVAYMVARSGFISDRRGPLVVLGIAWFVACLPATVESFRERVRADRSPWYLGSAAVVLWSMVGLTLLGLLDPSAATVVGLGLAAAGVALLVLAIVRVVRARVAPAPLALVVFGLVVAGVIGYQWWGQYQTPLFLERLVVNAISPPDTLFHAAIANMFGTYTVPSTGIDGLPVINYHFGSHVVMSSMARLAGVPVLRFYQYGFQTVIAPAVLMALLLAAAAVRRALGSAVTGRELLRGWWPWLVAGTALVGLLPPPLKRHLWQSAWLVASESYALALLFGLLWIALVLRVPEESERSGASAWLLVVLVLPLLMAAAGMAKVSVMVLIFPVASYLALRSGLWRNAKVLVGLAVATVLATVTLTLVQSEGHFEIAFLDFPKGAANSFGWGLSAAAALKFLPFLLLGHWMFTLVYLGFRYRDTGFRSSRAGSRLGLLDVEVLLLVTLLGFLPGLLLKIPGGSAAYFSDVQRYLAAALLLGRYATLPIGASVAEAAYDTVSTAVPGGAPVDTARGPSVARTVVTVVLIGVFAWTTLAGARMAVDDNRAVRTAWGVTGGTSTLGKPTADHHPEQWEVVRRLEMLSERPLDWKRKTALYIPRGHTYWEIPEERGGVFLAPAITGIAAVGSLPESARTQYTYGYDSYTPWAGSFGSQDPQLLADVRARAKGLGFERLVVFRAQSFEEISLR